MKVSCYDDEGIEGSPSPLPAHQTKHLATLRYPLWEDQVLRLHQIDSVVDSTGRTVWLGAQLLSVYLHEVLKSEKPFRKDGTRKRAIDLGAGTGLLSLSLFKDGFDVLATDIELIASTLLLSNINRNTASTTSIRSNEPRISAASLDWFIDPSLWDFSSRNITHPSTLPPAWYDDAEEGCIRHPFDMIVTSDSVYSPELSTPLLRTLHALSSPPFARSRRKPPPIYLCLERRDPALVDAFFESARNFWGFKAAMVDRSRLERLVGTNGWGWSDDDWSGVEIWKMSAGTSVRVVDGVSAAEGG